MTKKNVTAFEFNEDLKENCILLGATKATTTRFKEGVPIIPEEFWETIIVIPKTAHINLLKVIFGLVQSYVAAFEVNNLDCSRPVLEYAYGEPRIIYAVFPGKKSFFKKFSTLASPNNNASVLL